MRLILEVGKNEKSEHEKFRSMTAVSCICWVPMLLSMDMRTEQRIRWSSSAELQHEKSACLPVSKKVTSRCEASWDQFAFALTAKCLMLSLGGSTYNLWWCVWCVNHKLVTQGRIQHRCTSKRRTSLKCRMVGWRIARIQRLYTCLFNEKQQQHQLHCRDLRSLLACYLHDSFSTWWESKALPQTKWFFKL